MTIIDTHTHLYDVPDAGTVLRAAAAAGVSDVVVLGVDLASNRKHLELAGGGHAVPRIHLAFGLHPGNITSSGDTEACLSFIREHAPKALAIGECGLDFHYKGVDEARKREQRDAFARQLALAKEFDLPVVVHSRAAFRESLEMLAAAGVAKADFHWYTGPLDVLKDILDKGFFVSVSPALEYSPEAKAVAAYAPLGRILVETDTPVRGWTPVDVWRTEKKLAAIKGLAEEDVLAAVNTNARAFFNIPVL